MNWTDYVIIVIISLNFLFLLGAKEQDRILKYGFTAILLALVEFMSLFVRNLKG